MFEVSVDQDGDFQLYNMQNGTKEEVTAVYTASCCINEANIMGKDGQGNKGICSFYMDPLAGKY